MTHATEVEALRAAHAAELDLLRSSPPADLSQSLPDDAEHADAAQTAAELAEASSCHTQTNYIGQADVARRSLKLIAHPPLCAMPSIRQH